MLRRLLRPLVCLAMAAGVAVVSNSLFWVPLVMLAAFFFAVDVMRIDKAPFEQETVLERDLSNGPVGVLGRYVVDSTESLGLFFEIGGKNVFVDIREDDQVEARQRHALFLAGHQSELEASVAEFRKAHPEFAGRRLAYIGVHRPVVDECEVFWAPEGHSLLKGLSFVSDH
jgi:hypothetical protein